MIKGVPLAEHSAILGYLKMGQYLSKYRYKQQTELKASFSNIDDIIVIYIVCPSGSP